MQTYAAISTTVIGSVAIAISVANTTQSWGWGLLAGVATALATFAGWRIALDVQARRRRRSDKQQERDLDEAVVLGAPIHVEPFLHVFGEDRRLRLGAPKGKEPFIYLSAPLRDEASGATQAQIWLFEEPQPVDEVEIDLCVPLPLVKEQQSPRKDGTCDRCAVVDVLRPNGDRIVSCAIYAYGAAQSWEPARDGNQNAWRTFANAPTFRGGHWYTVSIVRSEEGSRVMVSADDGSKAQSDGSETWPPEVHVQLRVMSGSLPPRGWFGRPRLS